MERTTGSDKFPIGSLLPDFTLPGVDGRSCGSEYLRSGKAALVVFTCNHCPYVKGSEQMLIEAAREFEARGLKTTAISANDAAEYPEDSLEKMQEKSRRLGLPYPYLYDQSQDVARLFDAACTPECYLFDSSHKLVYHGAINDSPKESAAAAKPYLKAAIETLLEGRAPDPAFVHPIGCSIKWKRS
jgi:peroxiredoxin